LLCTRSVNIISHKYPISLQTDSSLNCLLLSLLIKEEDEESKRASCTHTHSSAFSYEHARIQRLQNLAWRRTKIDKQKLLLGLLQRGYVPPSTPNLDTNYIPASIIG
jgi:hypothetical protein